MLNSLITRFAAGCSDSGFFGLPMWYKYLPKEETTVAPGFGGGTTCSIKMNGINDIWLVAVAVIEILMRVGALVAFVFIIVGGVRYIISQGEPDRLKKALGTIISASIGLIISLSSVILINFIAGEF